MNDIKSCSKSTSEKVLINFHEYKKYKDGSNSVCIVCRKINFSKIVEINT